MSLDESGLSSDEENYVNWSNSRTDYSADTDEEYNPCGAESDGDKNGCCHWSTTRQEQPNQIVPDNDLPELGTCCVNFESETKVHEIVEQIIDQHFLDLCVEATNAHRDNDPNYLSMVGILTQDEKGRAFIKGFLSIKWHLFLVKYPSKRWA